MGGGGELPPAPRGAATVLGVEKTFAIFNR